MLLVTALLLAFLSTLIHASNTDEFDPTPGELSLIKAFGPWPMPVPDDPGNEYSGLAWAEAIGESLFNDPSLSGDESIACNTCHLKTLAFSDGLPLAVGKQNHVRNTQGLLNSGYQRWFGWDGGADSLWAASLRPMLSEIEMHATVPLVANRYKNNAGFIDALRREGIKDFNDEELVVIIAKLIAAYQRTLLSPPTRFDEYRTALLNDDPTAQQQYPLAAKRGMRLFFGDGNCHVCHFGPNFSNGEFHDTGRPFFTAVGQVDPGRYTGIKRVTTDKYNLSGIYNGTNNPDETRKTTTVKIGQSNFGQWRTPSLRSLTQTAPYMHDGSLPTLRAVIDSYADIDPTRLHSQGESILKPQSWSDRDREDLVMFLKTLGD